MESVSDLFNLPTAIESRLDRNYYYPIPSESDFANYGAQAFIKPLEWRRQRYRQMFHDYHHDNILRLQCDIDEHNQRIAVLSKGAMPGKRIKRIEGKKSAVVKRLRVLETGWVQIGSTLRQDSQLLFKLPRELREKIYGYLYDKSPNTLSILYPDPDIRSMLLPSDPYCYTNASVVDPEIAREAAQVLYDTNTFSLEDIHRYLYYASPSRDFLSSFLRTDHFGSGVLPKDVIRRLRLEAQADRHERTDSNAVYELQCRDVHPYNNMHKDRKRLAGLLEMTALRRITVNVTNADYWSVPELRAFSPLLKILKERGVAVSLAVPGYYDYDDGVPEVDYTWLLDEPGEEEWTRVNEHAQYLRDGEMARPMRHRTLWSGYEPVLWRRYYAEHQRVFENMELEEKMRALGNAKKRIDAVFDAIRIRKQLSEQS